MCAVFASWAFCHAAPNIWNCLPPLITDTQFSSFRSNSKLFCLFCLFTTDNVIVHACYSSSLNSLTTRCVTSHIIIVIIILHVIILKIIIIITIIITCPQFLPADGYYFWACRTWICGSVRGNGNGTLVFMVVVDNRVHEGKGGHQKVINCGLWKRSITVEWVEGWWMLILLSITLISKHIDGRTRPRPKTLPRQHHLGIARPRAKKSTVNTPTVAVQ